jgi:hypothetical protein
MFFVKKGICCFATAGLRVASAIALIAAGFFILASVVDGIYYYRLHGKMRECGAFVNVHVDKHGRFPSTESMSDWSKMHDVFPRFYLGSPGSSDSMSHLEDQFVKTGFRDFRIAYWDGDRFEFFNLWNESFTTPVKTHSGDAALHAIAFLGLASAIWFMRRCIQKNRRDSP